MSRPQARSKARSWVALGAILGVLAVLSACSQKPAASGGLPVPGGVWLHEADGAVTVHWKPVSDGRVTGYRVYVAGAAQGDRALEVRATVTGADASTQEIGGLTNGSAYRFAIDATGAGDLHSQRTDSVLGAPFRLDATPVASIETSGDAGTAVLADGRRFTLLSQADFDFREDTVDTTAGVKVQALPDPSTLPPRFTLAADQTAIRNQGYRGTCQTFAAVAAVEAAYKRAGYGDLDLSEQFASHITRTQYLERTPGTTAAPHENQLGMLVGWTSTAVLTRLAVYGVPLQDVDPNILAKPYDNPNQAGDVPRIDPNDATVSQRTYDDFNLQDEPTSYNIPGAITTTPFPREALTDAPYSITAFHGPPAGMLYDPTWYEQTLYGGNEVAFGFCTYGIWSDSLGIWHPGSKAGCLGHEVLLIGYDHSDPDHRFFIAKNSWGGTAYQKVGYDVVAVANDAAVVDGVPTPNGQVRRQRAMGRWDLVGDGLHGTLDVTRLPGFYTASWLHGQLDRRLGAFYDTADAPFRVNGVIDAATRSVGFFIDFANPALDYQTLSGDRFTATMAPGDATLMAGLHVRAAGGMPRGFYLSKEGAFASVPGGVANDPHAYEGWWRVHGLDGDAHLIVTSVLQSGVFEARYTQDGGGTLSGTIDLSSGAVHFSLPDGSGVAGDFVGSVHEGDPGTISGSYARGAVPGGLVLVREGDAPLVTIDTVGTLRNDGKLELGATAQNFPDLADVVVHWSYQLTLDSPTVALGTSPSGVVFTATGLPCDDLLVTAQATDAGRGRPLRRAARPACVSGLLWPDARYRRLHAHLPPGRRHAAVRRHDHLRHARLRHDHGHAGRLGEPRNARRPAPGRAAVPHGDRRRRPDRSRHVRRAGPTGHHVAPVHGRDLQELLTVSGPRSSAPRC